MHNLWFKVLREEKTDGSDAGGSGYQVPAESEEKPNASADNPPPKEDGDKTDDFGYEKPTEGDKDSSSEKPADDKKVDPPKGEDDKSVAGYDENETKVDPPAEEKQEEKKAPSEPDEYDKAEAFKDLDDKEVESLRALAKKHKLSPEAAKELGDLRRKELTEAVNYQKRVEKEAKDAIQRQRGEWLKELKNDGKFGGERFAETIKRTNKVLDQFFPRWKKTLTDRKGMLPPDVMRDLAELADHLYSKENVVNGQPPAPAEEKENDPDEHLKFYS